MTVKTIENKHLDNIALAMDIEEEINKALNTLLKTEKKVKKSKQNMVDMSQELEELRKGM